MSVCFSFFAQERWHVEPLLPKKKKHLRHLWHPLASPTWVHGFHFRWNVDVSLREPSLESGCIVDGRSIVRSVSVFLEISFGFGFERISNFPSAPDRWLWPGIPRNDVVLSSRDSRSSREQNRCDFSFFFIFFSLFKEDGRRPPTAQRRWTERETRRRYRHLWRFLLSTRPMLVCVSRPRPISAWA